MTLAEAVAAALAAGAHIEDAHTHPIKLRWEGCDVSPEVMVELAAADSVQLDKVLSWLVGRYEYLEHYRRAMAEGNERNKAWWRRRLLEDYKYEGPFPDDPTAGPAGEHID